MKENKIFIVYTGKSISRVEKEDGKWVISHHLDGIKVNCMLRDPVDNQRVYLGSQNEGVFVSNNGGKNWRQIGLPGISVKSLAVSPVDPSIIYAGCKPVSLYVSHDAGENWDELPGIKKAKRFWWFSPADPPGMTPYVSALAMSPANPDVIIAGIETGAVLRSEDGGRSWSKHKRGSDRDCHSLKFHTVNGNWVYEAGGIGGSAFSRDGGRTWEKPRNGIGIKYGWKVAADPVKPEIWYLSVSEQPNLLKGEFNPPAHQYGNSKGHIYVKVGDEPFRQLSGGLPEPLDYMANELVTIPKEPGVLYAGMANGDIWYTLNYGDQWEKLPFNLGRVHHSMVVI
jgi:hypothetical protein